MRSFIIAACLSILAGCSSSGTMIRPIAQDGPATVYIEKIDGDGYDISSKLESALVARGYDPVSDPAAASYRLKASYKFAATNTSAIVRLSDVKTGTNHYFGEGKNPGFGTLINPESAIWGCFERALSNLPQR